MMPIIAAALAAAAMRAWKRDGLRCGDHVFHTPSGESWVVAFSDGDSLVPSGWPATIARLADCKVTHLCTDEDHRAAVKGWSVSTPDWRQKEVMRLYGHVLWK